MTLASFAQVEARAAARVEMLMRRALARIKEARATIALEFGIVLYGLFSVYQSINQGGGYTKGWAILGKGITQPEYGCLIGVQCALRLNAILFMDRRWRYGLAWSSFLIHGTTAFAVRAANPTSPMLAPLVAFGVLGNLWVIGADVWTRDERP